MRARALLVQGGYMSVLVRRVVRQLRSRVNAARAKRAREAQEAAARDAERERAEHDAEAAAAKVRANAEERAAKAKAKQEVAAQAKAKAQAGAEARAALEAGREAKKASTWPRMPLFVDSARLSAKAAGLPADLALDPALHRFLFAHWDWQLAPPPPPPLPSRSGVRRRTDGNFSAAAEPRTAEGEVAITVESDTTSLLPRGGDYLASDDDSGAAGGEQYDELTKRLLGFGMLGLFVAAWAGVVLLEWVITNGQAA